MNKELFERLLYEEENATLDFKKEQYRFARVTNDAAYRCEVVNNGESALHGVSLVFMTTFGEGTGFPATRAIAITSPVSLEPKHMIAFHVADDTRQATEVVPPASVTARVGMIQKLELSGSLLHC